MKNPLNIYTPMDNFCAVYRQCQGAPNFLLALMYSMLLHAVNTTDILMIPVAPHKI